MSRIRPERLEWIAHRVVRTTMRQLPAHIRSAAQDCRIDLQWEIEPEEEDRDLLGLFEGAARSDPLPDAPDQLPRIRLFLANLWDQAEEDLGTFRDEVRITLLHELGHYLGFDEEQVADLGLA